MERQRILERERRWARPAAFAAILVAPLYIASISLDQTGSVPASGLDTDRYRAIEAAGAGIYASVGIRALAFGCMAAALLYLFKAVQARSERISGSMVAFAFIGPVLLAVQGIVAVIAQRQVASDFVAQAGAGGDVYTLLDGLIDDSTGLDVASNLLIPAILGLLVAMVYISLQAMRAGLLTRFFGTLGMALGAGLIFILPALSLLTIALWFLWLGLVILDRTPGPRPPAWEAGVAIPWPRPGESPPASEPAAEHPEELFEGNGDDGEEALEHEGAASGERTRKRKRKRRR